jgi:hypothetical protein
VVSLTSHNPLKASTASYGDSFTFLYLDDVRTSQETHIWTPTACYVDRFIFYIYIYVRTSQETYLRNSTACYRDSFTFLYVDHVRASQKTHVQLSTACYRESLLVFFCLLADSTYYIYSEHGAQEICHPFRLQLFITFVVKVDVRLLCVEEWRLLGCYAVWLLYEPAFRRNLAPPSSG